MYQAQSQRVTSHILGTNEPQLLTPPHPLPLRPCPMLLPTCFLFSMCRKHVTSPNAVTVNHLWRDRKVALAEGSVILPLLCPCVFLSSALLHFPRRRIILGDCGGLQKASRGFRPPLGSFIAVMGWGGWTVCLSLVGVWRHMRALWWQRGELAWSEQRKSCDLVVVTWYNKRIWTKGHHFPEGVSCWVVVTPV